MVNGVDGSEDTDSVDADFILDNDEYLRVEAGPCLDLRDECPAYAAAGGCSEDPRWMHPHCPVACAVCDQRLQFVHRSQAFGPRNLAHSHEVQDAVRGESLGVPQRLVPGHEDAVRDLIMQTVDYMERVVMEEDRYVSVRKICRNLHSDCAYWGTIGDCEKNEDYMLKHCAPVCQVCEQLHLDAKCRIDPNEKHGTLIFLRPSAAHCSW